VRAVRRCVEKALRKQPGVLSATVNLADERATIDFLPLVVTQPLLIAAIEKAGYGGDYHRKYCRCQR
jgi:Cu+-exporting ATPase